MLTGNFEALYHLLVEFDGIREQAGLDERALISHALAFANTSDLVGAIRGLQAQIAFPEAGVRESDFHEEFAVELSTFRAFLDAAVGGSDPDHSSITQTIRSASQMALLPSYVHRDGALRITHQFLALHLSSVISYVELLLLDRSRPYRTDLLKCQLPECGKFFLVDRSKSGRPQRKYCTEEHMKAAHRADVVNRVRASRAEAKARKLKKPRRRAK